MILMKEWTNFRVGYDKNFKLKKQDFIYMFYFEGRKKFFLI